MKLGSCMLLVAALMAEPCYAVAKSGTGNELLEHCRGLMQRAPVKNRVEAFGQGQCAGVVWALTTTGEALGRLSSCLPEGVNMGQGLRVVVKFLDEHPERTHEDFVLLAATALHEAWPCPN